MGAAAGVAAEGGEAVTDHAAFAMGWTSGLFMGMGLMKLAWERDNRHRRIAPPGHSRPAGPPQPLAADMIRYARWKDEQILRALRDDGGSPTTPKPNFIPKPQPPRDRVTDVYGRTIGYQPRPQGGTPNPPPTDP